MATRFRDLTPTDIQNRAAMEQSHADYLKRRGFISAAFLRGQEVLKLREIARLTDIDQRVNRLKQIARQRRADTARDAIFAPSWTVPGWKAQRTTQENKLKKAKTSQEKNDADTKIRKYDLLIARGQGDLGFNPKLGDENSLEALLISDPHRRSLVYFAECDNWRPYAKIGCSDNWMQRQISLQTSVPGDIRLSGFASIPVETDKSNHELAFHLALVEQRHILGREFFRISLQEFENLAHKLKSPQVCLHSGYKQNEDGENKWISLLDDLGLDVNEEE